jgi:hypothetical protein
VRAREVPRPRHFLRIRAREVCHSESVRDPFGLRAHGTSRRFRRRSIAARWPLGSRGVACSRGGFLKGSGNFRRRPAGEALPLQARRFAKSGRIAIGLVAGLGFLGAAAGATTAEEQACAVNRVDGVLAVGGFVEVTGFAFESSGAPVLKIQLTLDHSRLGETSVAGLRPDVLAHFKRPDYLWSGWSGRISLEKVKPGRHTVEMTAYTHTGEPIPCGVREIQVLAVQGPPERPTARIAVEMLWRVLLFLGCLTLVGLLPALATGGGPVGLRAPFLGLALFGIAAEVGSRAGLRPLSSALVPVALSVLLLGVPRVRRRFKLRAPAPGTLATLGCAVVFAAVGAVTLSSRGEGVVLGDIDDAIRECAVADSINMYGWTIPPDAMGYVGGMTREARRAGLRPGGSYLLSGLAQAFHTRAHAVHSVAMLGAGVLVVCGAGLLAHRVLRRYPRLRWVPAALAAVNSTLYATLANQHLGSLLFAALFVGFLFHLLAVVRSRSPFAVVPVAILLAAAWSYYPEGIATWGVAGLLSLFLARSRPRRQRTWLRLVGAVFLSVALNPIGVVHGIQSLSKFSGLEALSTPYAREVVGDTHYFPSLNVVTGLIAYREDAPAPTGKLRSLVIPVASLLILVTCWFGWRALPRADRWVVAILLFPAALALYVNLRLNFPYGFAKYLPLSVPIWSVAFSRLAFGAAETPRRVLGIEGRRFVVVSLLVVGGLSLPPARHVLRRIVRTVPSYDPAFRALSALAATVGGNSVLVVDEPNRARLEWMRYFVAENPVEPEDHAGADSRRRWRVVDRRREGGGMPQGTVASSRDFALVPVEEGSGRP